MSDKNIVKVTQQSPFDSIKHVDENGNEYWSAREYGELLKYAYWKDVNELIERAKISCKTHGIDVNNHFTPESKMVSIGSGAQREVKDYKLTRYACYLTAMNGDVRKKEIAAAQSYFAVQTIYAEQVQSGKQITQKSYSDVLRENAKLSLELADALDNIERIEKENEEMKEKVLM